MENTTTNASSLIYIERVENLYIEDKFGLATDTQIYIEKVEHLHMGKRKPATTVTNQPPTDHHGLPTRPTLSNSQLVLVCYYVLLSWDLRPRIHVNLTDVARFIHSITGIPYKNIDNSDIYRKLLLVPHLKSDQGLIKDLEVVQNLFLQLELKEAYLLVEKEITRIRQESNKPLK